MGSGNHQSEQYWKIFADLLERKELLQRQFSKGEGYGFTIIKLTSRGQEWISSREPLLKFVPTEQLLQLMTSEKMATSSAKPLYDTSLASASHGTLSINQIINKAATTSNKEDEELKRNLMMVRAIIASREGTMPYKIASEPAIDRLVQIKPLNLQELRDAKADGFSDTLLKQFGPEFLKCIQRSKGLLPQNSAESLVSLIEMTPIVFYIRTFLQDEKPHSSNRPDEKVNHTVVSTDNVLPMPDVSNKLSDSLNAFEDDDELFMNVEVDGEKLAEISNVQKPAPSNIATKVTRITTTVSKRVKYENSSSDEESPAKGKFNQAGRPQTSAQLPAKPVGIRKRNIF